MVKNKRSGICLLLFAFGLSLCAAGIGCNADIAPPGPDIMVIGAQSNGETINMAVGCTLELTLDSNPTTGYAWHTQTQPDASLLQVKEEYIGPAKDDKITGAGGQNKWTMKALKAGTTRLELVYKRDSESSPSDKNYAVTILIK